MDGWMHPSVPYQQIMLTLERFRMKLLQQKAAGLITTLSREFGKTPRKVFNWSMGRNYSGVAKDQENCRKRKWKLPPRV